jgi:hypothetical protein
MPDAVCHRRAQGNRDLIWAIKRLAHHLGLSARRLRADLRLDLERKPTAAVEKLLLLAWSAELCRRPELWATHGHRFTCDGHLSPAFQTLSGARKFVEELTDSLDPDFRAQRQTHFRRRVIAVAAERLRGRSWSERWRATPHPELWGLSPWSAARYQAGAERALILLRRDARRPETGHRS